MTNYDKIRSLTKKELSEFLCKLISSDACCNGWCIMTSACPYDGKSWLDEEIEEDDSLWKGL